MIINNISFTKIDLSDCYIGEDKESMGILKTLLIENKFLKTVLLRNNILGNNFEVTNMLKEVFLVNKKITCLDLSENLFGLKEIPMKHIKLILRYNETLIHLNLSNNKIGDYFRSTRLLCEGIAMCSYLKKIDLSSNTLAFSIEGMKLFSDNLVQLKIEKNN